jgi:multisubunit Na+/H+ antiporter MnhF subunit
MGDAMTAVDIALYAVAAVLLVCIGVGLWRAVRGPSPEDRLTAFVLLGTSGAALFVVLASALGVAALRDVAVTVVALATVVVVVYTRRAER